MTVTGRSLNHMNKFNFEFHHSETSLHIKSPNIVQGRIDKIRKGHHVINCFKLLYSSSS